MQYTASPSLRLGQYLSLEHSHESLQNKHCTVMFVKHIMLKNGDPELSQVDNLTSLILNL